MKSMYAMIHFWSAVTYMSLLGSDIDQDPDTDDSSTGGSVDDSQLDQEVCCMNAGLEW